MDNLKNLKGVCKTNNRLRCVIEQSPRKRTILTGIYGINRKSYYLAIPYVQFLPIIDYYYYKGDSQISISLNICMSKTSFDFKKPPKIYSIPLPNVVRLGICGSNRVRSNIKYKNKDIKDVNEVISKISDKIDELITDFWNSTFVGYGGGYPNLTCRLESWQELSKEDDMAAFKVISRLPVSGSVLFKNIKPPKDFPKMLKKWV